MKKLKSCRYLELKFFFNQARSLSYFITSQLNKYFVVLASLCLENPMDGGAWWAAVHGVARSWTWLSDFAFTFHFHALEKEMATHCSVLAWRIPGTGKPGRLQSMGLLESDTTKRLHFHFSLSCIGEGNGNPLQCSCLENPRDGGAWWAAIYGVEQSRTRLMPLSSSSSSSQFVLNVTCNWKIPSDRGAWSKIQNNCQYYRGSEKSRKSFWKSFIKWWHLRQSSSL